VDLGLPDLPDLPEGTGEVAADAEGGQPETTADPGAETAGDTGPAETTADGEVSPPDVGPATTTWTVLVYIASDNNLEKNGIDDILEMMEVPEAEHLTIAVQIDRAEKFYELGLGDIKKWEAAKRLEIKGKTVVEIKDLGEINTGDPKNLTDFIAWGIQTYPADRTVLVLWDHGNAWRGYGGDNSEEHDMLTLSEIDQAIGGGLAQTSVTEFALIGFDACLMADFATTQVMKKYTRYLVVSEEFEPGNGWDWEVWKTVAEDAETAVETIGTEITKSYKQQSRDFKKHHGITLGFLDLSKIAPVEEALAEFTTYASANLAKLATPIGAALSRVQAFGASGDPRAHFWAMDLGRLLEDLGKADAAVAPMAAAMAGALGDLVVTQVTGKKTDTATGLTMYFPAYQENYLAGFDAVGGVEEWRKLVKAYYALAAAATDAPDFNGGVSDGAGGEGGGAQDGICGDAVCDTLANESAASCPQDCDLPLPTYDVPSCDEIPKDPNAPAWQPLSYSICSGSYAVVCEFIDGQWLRKATHCPSLDQVCGLPPVEPGATPDPLLPPNAGQCVLPKGGATSGCSSKGEVTTASTLDPKTLKDVAALYLHFGFVSHKDGKPTIVGRVRASVDEKGVVSAEWNQRFLTVEQAGRRNMLFSESSLYNEIGFHEVPMVYTEPVACPCDLPGDPGYADTDVDGVANCLDPDTDGDGVDDKGGVTDNCPWAPNANQLDSDNDGAGDACEDKTNQPTLQCTPDPANVYGEALPAYLRVVTNEVQKTTESMALFIQTQNGTSEFVPKPGSRLWPRVLKGGSYEGWQWVNDFVLPMDPTKELLFVYQTLSGQLVLDGNGVPQLSGSGDGAQTLAESLGFSKFFLELNAYNFAGKGDRAYSVADQKDIGECPPVEQNWCPAGEQPDCDGKCSAPSHLEDIICDDGSKGPNFNCQVFEFDHGACIPGECPGGTGFIRDCDGNCLSLGEQVGDGTCQDGANPAIPNYACAGFNHDDGDCPCGDSCNGHGGCVADVCQCDAGWKGPFCEEPQACGDTACDALTENCKTCPNDCGACPTECGNGTCQPGVGESCTSCPQDCGACTCGDGKCSADESCQDCEKDCGLCPQCGDDVCQSYKLGAPYPQNLAETCATCPYDCGKCLGDCCASSETTGEWNPGGGCFDQPVAVCVCGLDPECCKKGWPESCKAKAVASCGLSCCTPSCADAECGGDGCGGSCGKCASNEACVGNHCEPLVPVCCDPQAGAGCPSNATCQDCVCAKDPSCCGGTWGPQCSTLAKYDCNTECACGCVPNCSGGNPPGDPKACGADGCGGSCGTCAAGTACNPKQLCSKPGACGDGTNDLGEDCDGGGVHTATCNKNCTIASCGDGIYNPEAEACDAGAGCTACACGSGYASDGWGGCVDNDECATKTHDCAPDAACANIDGSFTCACNSGFAGDGNACVDIDECADGADNCDPNADCANTEGSFTCACKSGLVGDGTSCTDVDECAASPCHALAVCANTAGSFTCACVAGYAGDGVTACDDVDECTLGTNDCDPMAGCSNTAGSFTCACPPSGYAGDGKTCADIDECATETDNCHALASCSNTAGSFTCTCVDGYAGDGLGVCDDLDECALDTDGCGQNASCANTTGSFTCTCDTGYTGDGQTCADVDECATGADNCQANADCTNTAGAWLCACPASMYGDGVISCDPCSAACAGCSGGTDADCIACASGYWYTGTDCGACATCGAGFYPSVACGATSDTECGACSGDCTTCTSSASEACQACGTGYALDDPSPMASFPPANLAGPGEVTPRQLGYRFVPIQNELLSHLGVADAAFTPSVGPGCGIPLPPCTSYELTGTVQVGLYQAGGAMLASATVDCSGTPEADGLFYAKLDVPVQLTGGMDYAIMGAMPHWDGDRPVTLGGAFTLGIPIVEDGAGLPASDPATHQAAPNGYSSVGFKLASTGCLDVDECALGTHTCTPQQNCVNTTGSFDCVCSGNLLVNGGAETGDLTGWTIEQNGGDGWATSGAAHSGSKSFITSYALCVKSQLIDLVANGLSPAALDASPTVDAEVWVALFGAPDPYQVTVELRDASQVVIDSWNVSGTASGAWEQLTHSFTGYPAGLRYIYYQDGGQDSEFWAGQYGAMFDDTKISVTGSTCP
jgi:hypothetical protein